MAAAAAAEEKAQKEKEDVSWDQLSPAICLDG